MNRLHEPSTWASVAALGQLLAAILPPAWSWIGHALTGAAGSAGVALRERKG